MSKGPQRLLDSAGRAVQLGQRLGKGGEGAVYSLAGQPEVVAKVYHGPMSTEKTAKMTTMIAMRVEALLAVAAWPLDILRSSEGAPWGLLMPRIVGHKDIHSLYTPKSRKREFQDADWRFLVHTAANIARAFAAVHEHGCVIGDVNHSSVLVSPKATVRLIDCDSLQITWRGHQFLCDVGVPTYTAPELQGKPFKGIVRSTNHDAFGLAVMVFHLLFMGRHPFAGRFSGGSEMPIERAIREFRFAFGAKRTLVQMEPPPHALPLDAVSRPVALLFERAFSQKSVGDGGRPSPREWITALDTLEGQLRKCQVNASHYYLGTFSHCPWCGAEAATGIVFFTSRVYGPSPSGFVMTSVWAAICAVRPPGPAPDLPAKSTRHVSPSPEARTAGAKRSALSFLAYATVCVVVVLLLLGWLPPQSWFWALVISVVFARCVKSWRGADDERFVTAQRTAEGRWNTIRDRWEKEAGDRRFKETFHQLQGSRQKWMELPEYREKRYRQLEKERENYQLRRFLESHTIEHATIAKIGPGRKASLESFGVETAWDLTSERISAVPGFGPALAGRLSAWRRSVEKQFRFDPSKGVDRRDIDALDIEINEMKRKLEAELLAGAMALTNLRVEILNARKAIRRDLENAFQTLLQAEADKRVVGL